MPIGSAPRPGNSDLEIKKKKIEAHTLQLKNYGLYGLEGRVQHGLDPAGMLAVSEVREIVVKLLQKAGIKIEDVEALTKELHIGAIWEKSDDLAAGEKGEVKAWMLLADECHEVNDRDLSSDEYLQDVNRIKDSFHSAEKDPQAALDTAVKRIIETAKEKFTLKDGVPFAEEDAFLFMAIAGEKFGVCKDGDLYFAGAAKLDYSILEQEGLVAVEKEDRGRVTTFYQRNGEDVVKVLYPGLAIVFGDENLALRLARSAEK